MDLHILGLCEAVQFDPVKKTYAMRIHSSWDRVSGIPHLLPRQKFIHICHYTFDDVEPGLLSGGPGRHLLFNADLAEQILREFDAGRGACGALMVHCTRGLNRSPAVGIALNELFDLGHSTQDLKRVYNETNWYVYDTLMEAGSRIFRPNQPG